MLTERDFYILFSEVLGEAILKEFSDIHIKISKEKNIEGEEIFFSAEDEKGMIHRESLRKLYREYGEGYSLDELKDNFIGRVHMTLQRGIRNAALSGEEMLSNVNFEVVDRTARENKELLECVASTPFLGDLSFVYRLSNSEGDRLITKKDIRENGLTTDDLFIASAENAEAHPIKVSQLEILGEDELQGKNRNHKIVFAEMLGYENGAVLLGNADWISEMAESMGGKMFIEPFTKTGLLVHNIPIEQEEFREKIKVAKETVKRVIRPGAKNDLTANIYAFGPEGIWQVRTTFERDY